jgi:hypothetical protein
MLSLEILTVDNGRVIPSITVYTIPELNDIINNYPDDYLNILTYLYYLCYPKSAYRNLPENEKEDSIWEDYPGDYTPDDGLILAAKEKLTELYTSPTSRFFTKAKKGLETLGDYLEDASITDGKDGNFAAFSMNYTRIGKIIDEFKKLEKAVDEELGSTLRGGGEEAYDE